MQARMASSSKQRKQHVEHAAPQLAKPQPARELVDDFLVDPDLWESHAVKSLLSAARTTRAFAYSESFSAFVLLCIVLAGVLVGLQTYNSLDPDAVADSGDGGVGCPKSGGRSIVCKLDSFVLIVFTAECLFKIAGEGLAPWRFFTGRDWKWNTFDFVIVVLCTPGVDTLLGADSSSAALLRLMRLMRLVKLFKRIPQLQVIVMGLVGGIKSIAYILLLLFLIFYLYGIVGIFMFAPHDPWHFGDLTTAVLSLFRASTMEDWTDLMYITIYGCRNFPGGIYVSDKERTPTNAQYWCTEPNESQGTSIVSVVYWVTFIVMCGLVMLSLFIGAVTMSMTEALEKMKWEEDMLRSIKARLRARARLRALLCTTLSACARVSFLPSPSVLHSALHRRIASAQSANKNSPTRS
jgi:voltage-gated sodium channel